MAGPSYRITRSADGRIAVRLMPREREILGALVTDLAGETDADDADDPGLARLRPPAFPDDPEAAAAFRELVAEDLEDQRQARLATVAATIDATVLDDAQAAAWLGAVNDLRLVHGTRLGVTEDSEPEPIDEHDPDAGRRLVFLWLGWIEEQLVDAMAAGLPDTAEAG